MHRISRTASFVAGLVLGIGALAATASASADTGGVPRNDILRAPMQGSMLSDPPLFGLTRGGAPWVISEGTARLRANGDLRVEVEGLIIPTTGVNPVPRLSATVACSGVALPPTATVPFSTAGDAVIEAHVMLPPRCLAPAVLLNPNGNPAVYIAATGR